LKPHKEFLIWCRNKSQQHPRLGLGCQLVLHMLVQMVAPGGCFWNLNQICS
jgi:hypothetical protein